MSAASGSGYSSSYDATIHHLTNAFRESLGKFIEEDGEAPCNHAALVLSAIEYRPNGIMHTKSSRVRKLQAVRQMLMELHNDVTDQDQNAAASSVIHALSRFDDFLDSQRFVNHLQFLLGALSYSAEWRRAKKIDTALREWNPRTDRASLIKSTIANMVASYDDDMYLTNSTSPRAADTQSNTTG